MLLQGIYAKEMKSTHPRDICAPMFIAEVSPTVPIGRGMDGEPYWV